MSYAKKGRKEHYDEDGNLNENGKKFSLEYLLENCDDFINELNDLEHLASEISLGRSANKVTILFSPKFHCELAGEGIEYSWGASKRIYEKKPLSQKRSYAMFEEESSMC